MRMSQAVLPAMRSQQFGRIVNISSIVGFLPAPYMGVYAATKHALEGLSESLDHEVRAFGVRVMLVQPAFTRTNIDAASVAGGATFGSVRGSARACACSDRRADRPAPEATAVARTVERALGHPSFARFPVGFQARLLSRLRKIAPAQAIDRSIRKKLCARPELNHHRHPADLFKQALPAENSASHYRLSCGCIWRDRCEPRTSEALKRAALTRRPSGSRTAESRACGPCRPGCR
jgi:hypothetical protein